MKKTRGAIISHRALSYLFRWIVFYIGFAVRIHIRLTYAYAFKPHFLNNTFFVRFTILSPTILDPFVVKYKPRQFLWVLVSIFSVFVNVIFNFNCLGKIRYCTCDFFKLLLPPQIFCATVDYYCIRFKSCRRNFIALYAFRFSIRYLFYKNVTLIIWITWPEIFLTI